MNKSIGLLLAALSLSGCVSMAPVYQRPNPTMPAALKSLVSKPGSGQQAPLSISNWRGYFIDLRVQSLIEMALTNNRDLRISVARVEEARALYGIARAERLPSANLNLSRTENQTPQRLVPASPNPGGEPARSRRADVNLGLLAFELDFWGRVASLSQAAQAAYLSTEQAQRAFELSLIADVADAEFSLREFSERAGLAARSVASRSEAMALIAKRREVGLASDFDLLSAQGALEAARAELAALERSKTQAFNFLRMLVGTDAIDRVPVPAAGQSVIAELIPGLTAEVLLSRPDILAAEQRLIAANANIGAARAAFFPRIALTGSFGSASTSLSGLFEANSAAWTFTPSISLPLFNGGKNAAALDLANARKIIAVAEYEKTIEQAFREVADALSALDTLRTQTQSLQSLEKAQAMRLDIANARYQVGVASMLEVLDAQRELFLAQQNRAAIERLSLSVRARLFKALGGA